MGTESVTLYDWGKSRVVRTVTLAGHIVWAVLFSKDGKALTILAQPEKRASTLLRQIDCASGRTLHSFSMAGDSPIDFTGDGMAASFDADGALWIWSLSGKKRKLCRDSSLLGHIPLFRPDGKMLLLFQHSGPVLRRFDVESGKELPALRLPIDVVRRARPPIFSPDGRTLALVQEGGVISLWDATTGKRRNEPDALLAAPTWLHFSPDGRMITTFSEADGVCRWDASSGRRLAHLPAAKVSHLFRDSWTLHPAGDRIVHARWRSVEVLALPTGKRLREWRINDRAVGPMVISPSGQYLAMLGKDGVVRLWNLETGRRFDEVEIDPRGARRRDDWLLFSPDSRNLVIGDGGSRVSLWNLESGRVTATLKPRPGKDVFLLLEGRRRDGLLPHSCFRPDGRRLFCSFSTTVQVWDLDKQQDETPLSCDPFGRGPAPLAVSADGRFLARRINGALSLVETASGQVALRLGEEYGLAAFSPTGWRLAAVDQRNLSVPILDLPSLFLADAAKSKQTPEELWADLANPDASIAQRAVWRAGTLPEAVAFLGRKLSPVERIPPARLEQWVKDLGSDVFAKREQAERSLAAAREAAKEILERTFKTNKDLEVHRRAERLLKGLEWAPPDLLRQLRAVMVLEVQATPAARRLLRRLASGVPEARLTSEAKAALTRLGEEKDLPPRRKDAKEER
jgi:WD40 repeat protein